MRLALREKTITNVGSKKTNVGRTVSARAVLNYISMPLTLATQLCISLCIYIYICLGHYYILLKYIYPVLVDDGLSVKNCYS
jgi:hypothetical protein